MNNKRNDDRTDRQTAAQPVAADAVTATDPNDADAAVDAAAPAQGDAARVDDGDDEPVTLTAAQWRQLQQQLNSQQEQVLRIKAEADNQLKREQRQLQRHRQVALESIMRQLLEVRDSMEMGLQASTAVADADTDQSSTAAQQLQALRNGMQMTLRLLDKAMADNHAEIIDPQGQAFDPQWHEAVSVQANSGMPKDTVVAVMQKGCRLHDRLLRPAMVVVSAG